RAGGQHQRSGGHIRFAPGLRAPAAGRRAGRARPGNAPASCRRPGAGMAWFAREATWIPPVWAVRLLTIPPFSGLSQLPVPALGRARTLAPKGLWNQCLVSRRIARPEVALVAPVAVQALAQAEGQLAAGEGTFLDAQGLEDTQLRVVVHDVIDEGEDVAVTFGCIGVAR